MGKDGRRVVLPSGNIWGTLSAMRRKIHPWLLQSGIYLAMSILLGFAYTQEPLFFAHQYYLHGLAKAGFGLLNHDWLFFTLDAFPLFTAIVAFTHRFLFDGLFYVYHMLLLGVYAVSMISIADCLWKIRSSRTAYLLFLGAFIGIHSALWMIMTMDMGNVLFNGVANFYLLGPIFQPALFGVFLVTSVSFFLKEKVKTAILIAGLVPWMHATYLLCSGALIATYFFVEIFQKRSLHEGLEMIALGTITLAPPFVFTLLTVAFPTTPELMKQAQDILVHIRIPHHALPSAALSHPFERIVFVLGALWLVRRTRIALVLLIPLTICICLTLLTIILNNESLMLLFPWRISVILMPLALTVILGYIAMRLDELLHDKPIIRRLLEIGSILAIGASVVYGATLMAPYLHKNYNPKSAEYQDIVRYVSETLREGTTYLIPPKNKEFMFFRLQTGAPVYVDWKSHPFGDNDIVEWYKRIQEVQPLYEPNSTPDCAVIKQLRWKRGVTHMILWKGNPSNDPPCPNMRFLHGNEMYSVVGLL